MKTVVRNEQPEMQAAPEMTGIGRILVVDDEPRMTASVKALLDSEGHETTEAHSGEEAIDLLQRSAFEVVLVDVRMPRVSGLDVLRAAREQAPERPVIMMTAYASLDTAIAAINEGAYDYLTKPIDLTELRLTVRRAVETYHLHVARNHILEELQEKHKTLSRRVVELNALHEVGATLSTTGETDKLLRAILNLATGVIGAEYGSIMLLEPGHDTLRIAATSGYLAAQTNGGPVPIGDSIAGQVAVLGEPVIVKDLNTDPRFARRNRPQFETSSLICAPLKTPNAILGVINLSDKRNHEPFSMEDLRLLVTLAAQAAMAIEDAEHFQLVTRRLDEVTALHELSNRLADVERTDQMVAAVFDTLHRLTGCDRIQWWEWQADPVGLVLRAERDHADQFRTPSPVSVPLEMQDIADENRCVGEIRRVAGLSDSATRMGSVLSLPVQSSEHPLGVFLLHRDSGPSFSDYERHLVQIVGSQAERIFERQRALLSASRLVTMGKMISEISHDLRKPLTNIRGALQVMHARCSEIPENRSLLEDAEQEVVRLATLVTELVNFSNPKRYRTERRDMVPVLNRAISLVRRAADRAKVSIECVIPDHLPPIFCDENQIIESLLNVLMNAIEAMSNGGTLTVRASLSSSTDGSPDLIDIAISDTGPGMTRAELARVFERYYTTKPSGTGLGLAIVQRIINSCEGTVTATSEPGIGTTFRIQLPVR